MENQKRVLDASSHLILHLTSKADVRKGVPIVTRAEGVNVWDAEGNKYIDLVAGVTRPIHIGYGNKELARSIYDQIMQMTYFTPMGWANTPAMQLAEVLAGTVPGDINRFTFECGGSEAVETAMKLAKHYHYFQGEKGRFKIISRHGAYHGVNGIGLRALGSVIPMRNAMEPIAPGSLFLESPYCYRCPLGMSYPNCDMACARSLEGLIEFEGSEWISAFIGEPIQQGFGALAPPPEYWPIIRKICDRHGILLIIDEVICGFGRTGKMFGHEHFDVQADIVTMAKGITSGYVPLGAVGCTDKVWEPIDIFNHLHTYGNHPVSCAAGLKTVEIMTRDRLVERSARLGAYFLEGLQALAGHSIVGEVRGSGLWTAIDFTADKKTRAPLPAERLMRMITRAKSKGLIIKLAPVRMAFEFAPPLTISKEEIDTALRIIEECIVAEERGMGLK